MRSTAIILSGGRGSRLGSDIPKQYIEICGKPLLAYTIMDFEKSLIDDIIIVAAEEYIPKCEQIAKAAGAVKVRAVVPGGAERYDSVLAGLRSMTPAAEDIVLIHDGARPYIRPQTIDQIIRAAAEEGAVIAASACTDTIKIIDEERNIVATTQRRFTWAAQTPQAFPAGDITRAYEQIIGNSSPEGRKTDITEITDDAMVYRMAYPDRSIKVIDAGKGNSKITTAEDLSLAEIRLAKE